jgi:hypothetical protein
MGMGGSDVVTEGNEGRKDLTATYSFVSFVVFCLEIAGKGRYGTFRIGTQQSYGKKAWN